VLEARYVGNRAMDLWHQYSINETDVLQNGFLNEFNLAEQNLIANKAAGRGNTFAYFGTGTGTSPLPTIFGLFQGKPTSQANDQTLYTSTLFSNSSFTNTLNPALPSALSFAATVLNNPKTFLANQAAAGIPANFFVVNPNISSNAIGGGSFVVDNSGRSYYDAFVIELRRRLAHGLLIQGSYTFSRSMSNEFANSSAVFANYVSLQNPNLNRAISPFDIRHGLKMDYIYELPFGKGQRFLDTSSSVVDRLIGGWALNGTVRIQSGTPFNLGNVQLVGMTKQDLQDAIQIRKDPSGVVFWLPSDIIQNTVNAFNGNFSPTGRYIAPANMNAAVAFPGQVGFPELIVYGPRFVRFDTSFVKKTKINERLNVEFRAELLDAFNNSNIRVTSPTGVASAINGEASATFGQTTNAYNDLNGTNDPGGRIIQFVLRINF